MILSLIFKKRAGSEKTTRPAARTARRKARPNLEYLEDRRVPTVTIQEFPTVVPSPYAITAGPNNTVAFTESYTGPQGQIGSMTYPGGYSFIQTTPTGDEGYSIAQDQGNLWVLEFDGISHAHYIARYGLGANYYSVSGTPMRITADSQGNLWYTQQNPGYIVKVDPNNPTVPVVYEVPGSGVAPTPITVGFDGNIWFGAYTAAGEIIEYLNPQTGNFSPPVSLGQDYVTAITATLHGVGFTLVTNGTDGAIGVLKNDLSGLQVHPIPTPGADPVGIALGPDGNLWFTEAGSSVNGGSGQGKVGWASSKTGVVEGEIPTPIPSGSVFSQPLSITQGPDFPLLPALWFTDQNGHIGRIDFPIAAIRAQSFNYNIVAGGQMHMMVKAVNDLGAVMPGYRGTVHFSSSDPLAVLPADYTFTAADQGEHLFTLSLRTAGQQTVTVTDTDPGASTAAPLRASVTVTVQPAAAAAMTLSGLPSGVLAGSLQSVTVTLRDPFGNLATGYRGTVHFGSSDPLALLPLNYTFTAADAGVHTFPEGVRLLTAGLQSVTVTDTANPLLSAHESTTVIPIFAPSVGPATLAGERSGNVAKGYRDIVHLGSSGRVWALPVYWKAQNADAGVHTFVLSPVYWKAQNADAGDHTFLDGGMLLTPGPHSVTATDTLHPILSAHDSSTVTAGGAPPAGSSASAAEEWAMASVLVHKKHGQEDLPSAHGRDVIDYLFAGVAASQ
jgi:streptogramin lyase